jgi:hypothetical protein
MADKEWRCFFCDDVFTDREAAALHFGCFDSCEPDVTACKLMAHQQHVLEYIRGLEEEVRLYQAENYPAIKAMYALEDDMRRAVKAAEEKGYARGVDDMRKQGFCVEPGKHNV